MKSDRPDDKQVTHVSNRNEPNFWLGHILGRGIGSGIIMAFVLDNAFPPGFIFGVGSALSNIALRAALKDKIKNIESPEAHALAYVGTGTAAWSISAGVMHALYNKTGMGLFRINKSFAVAACAIEVFGFANNDLLKKKQ